MQHFVIVDICKCFLIDYIQRMYMYIRIYQFSFIPDIYHKYS